MLVGRYTQAGEYKEEIFEGINLKNLDKCITRNVNLYKDINVHIVPGIEVRVFAKNYKDICIALELEESQNYFKDLFDVFSKHNKSVNGEYLCTDYTFEERRRALSDRRMPV
jgi:hypothetical protein